MFRRARRSRAKALKQAYEELEDQEDVDLYHTKGWCRELCDRVLGMTAVLPPPEEMKHVKTAIGGKSRTVTYPRVRENVG